MQKLQKAAKKAKKAVKKKNFDNAKGQNFYGFGDIIFEVGGEKMDLTVWNEKDKLFMKVCGEVDHHAVKDTRAQVDGLIVKNRPKTLVMDLSQIDFMDSSGLGFVLGRYRKMTDLKGDVVVINPARRVEEMLRLAGADKMIKIVRTPDAEKPAFQ